jgi:hypothetical protein
VPDVQLRSDIALTCLHAPVGRHQEGGWAGIKPAA